MYRAIKCQTEKGPIDMVTGKSYNSLNDESIISERLTYEEMVSLWESLINQNFPLINLKKNS